MTGKPLILHGSARTENEAEKLLTRLLSEADQSAAPEQKPSALVDRWLPQHDVDETTGRPRSRSSATTSSRHLEPYPWLDLRGAPEIQEEFYADLRTCRLRSNGRRPIEPLPDNPVSSAYSACLERRAACMGHAAGARRGHRPCRRRRFRSS